MSQVGVDKSVWLWDDGGNSSKTLPISLCQLLCLIVWQDEAVAMGTVRRDGRSSAGLPGDGSIRREPVHKGAAGKTLFLTFLDSSVPVGMQLFIFVLVRQANHILRTKEVHKLTTSVVSCQ